MATSFVRIICLLTILHLVIGAYENLKFKATSLSLNKKITAKNLRPLGPQILKARSKAFAKKTNDRKKKKKTRTHKSLIQSLVKIDFSTQKDSKGAIDLTKTKFTEYSFAASDDNKEELEKEMKMLEQIYNPNALKKLNKLFGSQKKSKQKQQKSRRLLAQTEMREETVPPFMLGVGAIWYYGPEEPWFGNQGNDQWSPFCSAAVINDNFILTAAHCVMMTQPSMDAIIARDQNNGVGSMYYLTDPTTLYYFPHISRDNAPPGAPGSMALNNIEHFTMDQAWVTTTWYNTWQNNGFVQNIDADSYPAHDIAVIRVVTGHQHVLQHPMRIHAYVDSQWPTNNDGDYWWWSGYPASFGDEDSFNWKLITSYDIHHNRGTLRKTGYVAEDSGRYLMFSEQSAGGASGSSIIANDGQVYAVLVEGAKDATNACPITRQLYLAFCVIPGLIDCHQIDNYLANIRENILGAKVEEYNYYNHDDNEVSDHQQNWYYDQGYVQTPALVLLEYVSVEFAILLMVCVCLIAGAVIGFAAGYFIKIVK